MRPVDPRLRSRRRTVLTATSVAVLVLGLVVVKLVTMQVSQILGAKALASGDTVAADRYFAASGRINVVERWIAPYNRGVGDHQAQQWARAALWFEQAAALVPDEHRCQVVSNWALSLEVLGDQLAAAGDQPQATIRWGDAEQALATAPGCDRAAQQRLAAKGAGQDDGSSEEPSDAGPDQRSEQLAERNADGARDRQESQDATTTQENGDGPRDSW